MADDDRKPLSKPPLGRVEPQAGLLRVASDEQRLFKVMSIDNLISSVAGRYLYFNRVDSYGDFPGADIHDGKQLPADRPGNASSTFMKAPTFSVADYYDRSRGRTYACCLSLDNSDYIWQHYGGAGLKGKACVVFNFARLRALLNRTLESGTAALNYNGLHCHQIFSINYGLVDYVDWATYQANATYLPNPIQYIYLKDRKFDPEQELRISLAAFGMGHFILNDGTPLPFPPSLQLAFDFREAIAEGAILEILHSPESDEGYLIEKLGELGIGQKP